MRRRPLVWLAGAWMAGILIAHEGHLSAWPIAWSLGSALFALWLIAYFRKTSWWSPTALALVALIGTLFYSQTQLPFDELSARLPQVQQVEGHIVDYPNQRPDRSAFTLKLSDYPGSFQVFYYHKKNPGFPRFSYGDEVRLTGQFELPWTFEDFDYRSWLWTRDIWGIASVWSAKEIERLAADRGHPLLAWGYRTQLALFSRMDEYLGVPESALLKSLLFGEQAYLSPDVREDFRDAGVMHVLAVSGMNLGMIVSLFWVLLRALRLSVSSIYLILLPVALAFLTLAGFQVSLVRATLAFAFIALGTVIAERGWILRRWADPLQGLAAAALIILIVSPKALFDVSFQLSFAATTGILLALDWVMPRWKPYRQELQQRWGIAGALWKRGLFWSVEAIFFALIVSLAAQLAVAPFLASQFHRVYLTALLSNLAVVPLVTLTTWVGMTFLGFATLQLVPLAAMTAGILSLLLQTLIGLTGFMADFPGAYFPIGRDTWLNLLVLIPLLLNPLAWRTGQLALARYDSARSHLCPWSDP